MQPQCYTAGVMKTIISRDVFGNTYEVGVEELSWRPAAYAIVIHDNNILVVNEREKYHLPGGGIDLGEAPEEAAVREVREETGLTVKSPRLVSSLSTFFTPTYKHPHKPTHVQSLLLYYSCDFAGGELSLDGREDDEAEYGLTPEWVPLTALAALPIGSTVDWRPIVQQALHLT
jgi:8-oxo-dGTP diphosphatase